MSCYHPLYRIELTNEIGYKITKRGKMTNKSIILSEYEAKKYKNAIPIPCGQCIGCRLDYSRMWANRITLEAKDWKPETCWFITITYNNENIPTKTIKNIKTNDIKISTTLDKNDLRLFIMRLRRHYEYTYNHQGIRYYACGEYGETTNRPHYHICFFNLPIFTELKEIKKNELGQMIWTNDEIQKIWGKGFIAIAHQSWETAAYTARYMLKKQKGKDAKWYYESEGKIPEFTTMSTHPGIAKNYYDTNKKKIYENDEIIIAKGEKTLKIKPPKYYDNLYDIENHEEMEEIKLNRRINAQKRTETTLSNTNLSEEEYRILQENNQKQRIKKCKRTL